MTNFSFDSEQRFVLRNYHRQPAFSSFLPGIAGLMGIPLWVFYVNRGQGIASFGVESKDVPIVEFQPANKAYQSVPYLGFRTFIKIAGESPVFYEPFGAYLPDSTVLEREMAIGMNDLSLTEIHAEHQLQVEVQYFTLTDEPLAGLIRQVVITNTGQTDRTLEVIDGLPVIVPFGMNDEAIKTMSRTSEAWMEVVSAAKDVPYFRLRSNVGDVVEVEAYEAGHFYVSFAEDGTRLPALVDPVALFGENTSLSSPDSFVEGDLESVYAQSQTTIGRMPCGFFGAKRTLSAGESLVVNSIIGHAASIGVLQRHLDRIAQTSFLENQITRERSLARDLTDRVGVVTSQPLLDAYTRQTFLDNVLRGGWPVTLDGGDRRFIQHVYSRKHGDMERDYNAFLLAAEYYSQGNGNYRDVNQNRRDDVWLSPAVRDYNIVTFMNLLQVDGYNPLVVLGNQYRIPEAAQATVLPLVNAPEKLAPLLAEDFTPGSLLKAITVREIGLKVPMREFLMEVFAHAVQHFAAEPGEGFWTDHWTYNLDLIENYLGIYPDCKQYILFEKPEFTFYDNPEVVRPRSDKHVLVRGEVRQRGAVWHDPEKATLIDSRPEYPHVMRDQHGKGEIFRTTLIVKIVCLAAIKCATLDPGGMGIEMEANKPGWYDALNGLPGLFGSSMPETIELVRLLRWLHEPLANAPVEQLALPEELVDLVTSLEAALAAFEQDQSAEKDFAFWDASATARERYREATYFGFSGTLRDFPVARLEALFAGFAVKAQDGVDRATALNGGITPTYVRYDATGYEPLSPVDQDALQPVRVKGFTPRLLPLFLEGPARRLKIESDPVQALALHEKVKASALYDQALEMYKVNAPLDSEPLDIGRARAFAPGWLENESVFLHMEYKYMLSLLKAQLYAPFYAEIKQVLVPFQSPERYGRSPLENSSFLVSSAHPDTRLHGRGFVARLSGSTAEYLSMLNHLMFGPQPFRFDADTLTLSFAPALVDWLFDEQGTIECTFLGTVRVTYVNPARASTFGPDAVQPTRVVLESRDGTVTEVDGAVIPEPLALQVRRGTIAQITVHLG